MTAPSGASPRHPLRLGRPGPALQSRRCAWWPYDDSVARDLAIDLGTANTLVYAKGRGIVLNQPTVIALNTRTHEVLAVGNEAWKMIGRTPGYIVAVRPLREGAITDFDITERMIRLLLRRAGVTKLNRPRVLICVPSAITSVERRAVKEAARRAGASAAHLIEQPMAAAIGAGLDIHEPVGNMVVDVGGGTTETAVISLGGVVASQAIRCGGFDMDAAIQHYVRHEHGVAIGERTGEELKLAIGSALPYADEVKAEVRGREIRTGLPKTVVLSPEEVRYALRDQVELIVDTVVGCLAESPPELAQDIIYEGIHLVGGGAMLRGLANRLADETEVPVHLVATPLECVVLGAGHLPRFLRQPPAHLRRRRDLTAERHSTASRSSATWRTCQSRSSRQRRRAASTSGPSKAASATAARRRTAGLSSRAARTAGSPAGSPMAPSAATAASRHSGSEWPEPAEASATREGTADTSCRSPSAQAAISTTEASASSRRVRDVDGGEVLGQLAAAPPDRGARVGQRRPDVGLGQHPEPVERAQGGRPNRRGVIGQGDTRRRLRRRHDRPGPRPGGVR